MKKGCSRCRRSVAVGLESNLKHNAAIHYHSAGTN